MTKTKSKRTRKEAQKRNYMRFRLLGVLSALNKHNYDRILMTLPERVRLQRAYDAVAAILSEFRKESTQLGFGEPRLPKKLTIQWQRSATGVYQCWWRNFAANAEGETFDRMALAAVESLNRYMKVIGSSRQIFIEDLKFKCVDDE